MERGCAKIRRRSLRLREYNYASPGAYFITICTKDRLSLFGDIKKGNMRLTEYGRIVFQEREISTKIRQEITLDAFVGATGWSPSRSGPRRRSLGSFLSGFKSATTRQINELRQTPGLLVWQRNYYEHVIRNEQSLNRMREYIAGNPARWDFDRENPAANNPEPNNVWCGLD